MPNQPAKECTSPGCNLPTGVAGGRCDTCRNRRANDRGTPAARGYNNQWQQRRLAYLTRHPWCRLCGKVATVADHWPTSRRQLLNQGDADPDHDDHLRPLCRRCHSIETADNQPGGWHLANQAGR